MEGDGNGWVRCALGHRHWGRHGAAGLLLVDRRGPGGPWVLLQHRAAWTANGGTWGVPGGARDSHETAVQTALREAAEEAGVTPSHVGVRSTLLDDHGDWSYTTVAADLLGDLVLVAQEESAELRWVGVEAVETLPLHPGFAGTWPALRAAVRPSR